MEDTLFCLQNKLNKELLNTYIGLDEYNYNLLINTIITMINTVSSGKAFTIDNIIHKFTESYITFRCTSSVLTQNENFFIISGLPDVHLSNHQ